MCESERELILKMWGDDGQGMSEGELAELDEAHKLMTAWLEVAKALKMDPMMIVWVDGATLPFKAAFRRMKNGKIHYNPQIRDIGWDEAGDSMIDLVNGLDEGFQQCLNAGFVVLV